MDINITQSGEQWMYMKMEQKAGGLEFEVRTTPQIEDYFSKVSKGMKDVIEKLGNHSWYSIDNPLTAYIPQRPLHNNLQGYALDYPGYSFSSGDIGVDGDLVNLSFLRIVGIGSPGGVKFGVKMPLDLGSRRELRDDILMAVRKFSRDFIVPVALELIIYKREA